MTTSILVGDCRERLREMEPESVHCVVTSPPYWGLRDYGLPPLLWGGSECEHEWGDEQVKHQRGSVGEHSTLEGGLQAGGEARLQEASQGSFCRVCDAWRGSLGLEPTPELYVEHMVEVFREVRRVMRDDATLWLNLGDSYNTTKPGNKGFHYGKGRTAQGTLETGHRGLIDSLKPKDLCGIPWRVAFALQADGWWLRSDIIWHKTNPMPESVRDRPTKAHEYLFLLTKSKRYYYDQEAVREQSADPNRKHYAHGAKMDKSRNDTDRMDFGGGNGRNRRSVWTLPTQPFKGAHFATFPAALVEPCIKAGTSERGCCPSCGKGWKRVVEKTGGTIGKSWHDHSNDAVVGMTQAAHSGEVGNAKDANGKPYSVQTIGWDPGCECGDDPLFWTELGMVGSPAPPIPCTVLDPFGGSGTVGVVAARLGRDAVLCELNTEYAAMAKKRIEGDAPMFNEVEVR